MERISNKILAATEHDQLEKTAASDSANSNMKNNPAKDV